MENFRRSIYMRNGQYFVCLPWKASDVVKLLQHNYGKAKARLSSTMRALHRDPSLLRQYHDILQEYLRLGFVEEVEAPDFTGYFMPHQAVLRPDSATSPVRIVFDASCSPAKGKPSLNDCLMSGPSLTNELVEILLRFRIGREAAAADIFKAFLMVGLDGADRKYTQFLWPRDPWSPHSPLGVFQFRVVLFGATCSPFLLQAALQYHLDHYVNPNALIVKNDIYVDNLIVSLDYEAQLLKFYEDANDILADGGFPLKEWITNCETLKYRIDQDSLGPKASTSEHKVLGLLWNTDTDTLRLKTPSSVELNAPTKRSVVSDSAKLFDPIGFLSPLSIRMKLLIQDLWRDGLDWDDPLSNGHKDTWCRINKDLGKIINLQYPRQAINEPNEVKLHVFADASARAYGAVAYLSTENSARLLLSRTRVAPIKAPSVPKLEITAVLMATRIVRFLRRILDGRVEIVKSYIWTDSLVALSWIRSSKPYDLNVYVRNRVEDILSVPDIEFNHVMGKENPADLLTKKVTVNCLVKRNIWTHGPEWLLGDIALQDPSDLINEPEDSVACLATFFTEEDDEPFPLKRFNNLDSAIRVYAWLRRFISNCNKPRPERCHLRHLTVPELKGSEVQLVSLTQQFYAPLEWNALQEGKSTKVTDRLGLVMKEKLLICRGRLENADVVEPIYIPPRTPFLKLKMQQIHWQFGHAGTSETLFHFRRLWHTMQGRKQVRSAIFSCRRCRRTGARPYSKPAPGSLPTHRVTTSRPFENTGVDYAGPFFVKVKRSHTKAYIALFTCNVTRAIHLEVVNDASTYSFIQALRRFCARRGTPKTIHSDNAQTFKSADKQLSDLFDLAARSRFVIEHRINWKFIPVDAPWFGGFWERMVGLVKKNLKRAIGRNYLTLDEFTTSVVEAEGIINSRPLTYVSEDLGDYSPLTPSMLTGGYNLHSLPSLDSSEELKDPSFTREALHKRHQLLQTIVCKFWTTWRREYIASLRERHERDRKSHKGQSIPKMNDVVAIVDDGNSLSWKIGRIVGVRKDPLGIIRSVELKTAKGRTTRPVTKICPLETDVSGVRDITMFKADSPAPTKRILPLRKARRQ